jgi:RND family efflux transporter MFP subunit
MQKINFILLTCLLLTGCTSEQQTEIAETPPIPVIAVTPTIKDIPAYIESIGSLLPSVNMDIFAQVNGTLKEVYIQEGQWVRKNQPLMLIDPINYTIKVREAQAQLAMYQVELQAAQKKLERFRQLAQKDLVAQTDWDEIETQAAKAEAMLALGESKLQSAKNELEDCTLISPIDGRVGKLDAHPGLFINSGPASPLVKISKMDPLLVEFTLTENELFKMPNNEMEFEIQSLCMSNSETPCVKGKLTFFDNHYDQKSGQLLVRGTLPNPDYGFRPGQSVRVKIQVSTLYAAMLIPQKAVRYNDQGTYIYVVDNEKTVCKRQVILGEELGSDVMVMQGLDANEIVITDGHLRASPGLKVDVQL